MPKLYKLLASISILAILVITVILSFWVIVVGGIFLGIFGLYRHFFGKKNSGRFETRTYNSQSSEIIDIRGEVIQERIESIKQDDL